MMLFAAGDAPARDVNFEVSVDKNLVSIGEGVRMDLVFYGAQDIPAPEIKDIDGFQVRYAGPSKMVSIVNGRVASTVTHAYMLLPLKTGTFEIGPFMFMLRGDRYLSNKISIKVIEGALESEEKVTQRPADVNLGDRIYVTLEAAKTTAYLNEVIPLTIKLYIDRLSVRDIQFPTFAQESFSKAEFGEPKQYREPLGGRVFDVLEFNTKIFGTKTGEFNIGPAQVNCNVIMRRDRRRSLPADDFFGPRDSFFDDFFTQFERYPMTLKSKEAKITVLPLPKEGVPKDFSGSIGDFQFILDVSPKKVKAGDPITLKMSIYGNGNFNTVSAPQMGDAAGFKVYEPQAKTEDRCRTFEQVVIPESEKITAVPKISFSFFNPAVGRYYTVAHGPTPIVVETPPESAKPKIVASEAAIGAKEPSKEALGRDIIYLKESFGPVKKKGEPLYRNRVFQLLQLVPFLFLIVVLSIHSRSERLRKDVKYARSLRAPKTAREGLREAKRLMRANDVKAFYDAVFEALQGYLGDKFHLPKGGITAHIIDEVLVPRGFDEEALKRLKGLFDDCDLVRYAPSGIDTEKMRASLGVLQETIRYFERARL